MGVVARTSSISRVPWRPVALAALLIVAATAALALYAGSHRTAPAPPPFGPARNGTILVSTPIGDILSVDPVTNQTKPFLMKTGVAVTYSANGRWLYYDGGAVGNPGTFIANADGTSPFRALDDSAPWTWIDWNQAGDRLLATGKDAAGEPTILVVDPETRATTTLHLGREFQSVAQPFGTRKLLLSEQADNSASYFLINDDGSGPLEKIEAPYALHAPALSPDGSQLAYSTWGDPSGIERIHVMDLATRSEHLATPTAAVGHFWLDAQFSPDGTQILTNDISGDTHRLALVPASGSGPALIFRTARQNGEEGWQFFSPDGTTLVEVWKDQGVWLADVATGDETKVNWPTNEFMTWQRAAW